MKRTTLITVALALLVVSTGFAAAVPGNAPADAADAETSPGDAEQRGADGAHGNGAADGGSDDRSGIGPNVDLPAQVPDHVSAIHERISSFLNGGLDGSLGDAISSVTPDDDSDDDESTESDADETDA